MCNGCLSSHRSVKALRHHAIESLSGAEERRQQAKQKARRETLAAARRRCPTHPQKELEFWCEKMSCRQPMCQSCFVLEHKQHDWMSLEEGAARARGRVKRLLEEMKEMMAAVRERRALWCVRRW